MKTGGYTRYTHPVVNRGMDGGIIESMSPSRRIHEKKLALAEKPKLKRCGGHMECPCEAHLECHVCVVVHQEAQAARAKD